MNTRPTSERVAEEVDRLKAIRPSVPQYSAFGEDNLAAIDVQISMLQGDVTLRELFRRGDDSSLYAGPTQYTLDQAQLVHDWMSGQLCSQESSPAEGWEVFAK